MRISHTRRVDISMNPRVSNCAHPPKWVKTCALGLLLCAPFLVVLSLRFSMLNPALHPRQLLRWLCVLTCFVLWSGGALAASYAPNEIPNPRDGGFGNISNPDDLIDEGNAAQIQLLLSKLEADTGAQVAVVAVEDIHDPEDIFTFAHTLFERWGIGQKGRDNGLLVLMVRNQRVVRMQTGYGLEGTLPDLLVGRIQREHMAPVSGRVSMERGCWLVCGLSIKWYVTRMPCSPGYRPPHTATRTGRTSNGSWRSRSV